LVKLDVYFSGRNKEFLNFTDFARYFDTYGTPPDLIRLKLGEIGINLSELDFNRRFEIALQEIQKQSGVGHTERKSQISPLYAAVVEKIGANNFHGYETTRLDDAKVVAILNGENELSEIGEGEQGGVVLDNTPFYAESGGQVGDAGILVGNVSGRERLAAADDKPQPPATAGGTDLRASVHDTFSPVAGLIIHKVTVDKGSLKVGDAVSAVVDAPRRDATRRNHTATHLLHAALKEVLGSHVKQAGAAVAPNYLRFDFTHYQPMRSEERRVGIG